MPLGYFDREAVAAGWFDPQSATQLSLFDLTLLDASSGSVDATATPDGLTVAAQVGAALESVAAAPAALSITAAIGTPAVAVEVDPPGLSMVATVGAATPGVSAFPDGLSATIAVGSATATGDANATPAGIAMATQVGTAIESVAATPQTLRIAATVGTAATSVEAIPAGLSLTTALADPIATSVEAIPSGLTMAAVVADPVFASGDAVNATASPDGLTMTMRVGQVTAIGIDGVNNGRPQSMFGDGVIVIRRKQGKRAAAVPPPLSLLPPRLPMPVVHATATPRGLVTTIDISIPSASGSAVAAPDGVTMTCAIGAVVARGTHNLHDDELMALALYLDAA